MAEQARLLIERVQCEETGTATVPLLLNMGMSVEQIAQQLNVHMEAVRRASQQS